MAQIPPTPVGSLQTTKKNGKNFIIAGLNDPVVKYKHNMWGPKLRVLGPFFKNYNKSGNKYLIPEKNYKQFRKNYNRSQLPGKAAGVVRRGLGGARRGIASALTPAEGSEAAHTVGMLRKAPGKALAGIKSGAKGVGKFFTPSNATRGEWQKTKQQLGSEFEAARKAATAARQRVAVGRRLPTTGYTYPNLNLNAIARAQNRNALNNLLFGKGVRTNLPSNYTGRKNAINEMTANQSNKNAAKQKINELYFQTRAGARLRALVPNKNPFAGLGAKFQRAPEPPLTGTILKGLKNKTNKKNINALLFGQSGTYKSNNYRRKLQEINNYKFTKENDILSENWNKTKGNARAPIQIILNQVLQEEAKPGYGARLGSALAGVSLKPSNETKAQFRKFIGQKRLNATIQLPSMTYALVQNIAKAQNRNALNALLFGNQRTNQNENYTKRIQNIKNLKRQSFMNEAKFNANKKAAEEAIRRLYFNQKLSAQAGRGFKAAKGATGTGLEWAKGAAGQGLEATIQGYRRATGQRKINRTKLSELKNANLEAISKAIKKENLNKLLFGNQRTNNVNNYKYRIQNIQNLKSNKGNKAIAKIHELAIDSMLANQYAREIEGDPGLASKFGAGLVSGAEWAGGKLVSGAGRLVSGAGRLVSGAGRLVSGAGAAASFVGRRTDPAAAQVARLNLEIQALKNNPNANQKNLQNKIARRAAILARMKPEQRKNVLAVAKGEAGEAALANMESPIYNFSTNPLGELARAKKNYNKKKDPAIIGQVLQAMSNIWTKRTSETAARAMLKRFVNIGPRHSNISKMYQNLAGKNAGQYSSSYISKLFGSKYNKYGLGVKKGNLLNVVKYAARAYGEGRRKEETRPAAPAPAPAPGYPAAMPMAPGYPVAMPMAPAPALPPRVEEVVSKVGGIERANNLVKNAGGPEVIRMASSALNRSRGNVQLAMKQTGLPATTFTNVKKLGGPQLATRVAKTVIVQPTRVVVRGRAGRMVRRAPTRRVVRRVVRAPTRRVVRRVVRAPTRRVIKKKSRRVYTRRIMADKEIKKLIHKLTRKNLEAQVAQCLLR